MQQLMETAKSLGLQPPETEAAIPSPEIATRITAAVQKASVQDQKQQALIHALLPYLRPAKQRRLERAMQVARLSHLAGFALRSNSAEQEDFHV